LLALPGEISAGVSGCPSGAYAPFVGWDGTVRVVRPWLAAEKSAEAI
jgi:hypothetical protein